MNLDEQFMAVLDCMDPLAEAIENEFLDHIASLSDSLKLYLWFRHDNPTDHRWKTDLTDDCDIADSLLMDKWGWGVPIVRNSIHPRCKPQFYEEHDRQPYRHRRPKEEPDEDDIQIPKSKRPTKHQFWIAKAVRFVWDAPKTLTGATRFKKPALMWLERHGVLKRILRRGRTEYHLRPEVRGDSYQCKSVPFPVTVREMLDSGYPPDHFDGLRAWDSVRDEERNIVCVRITGVHFAGSVARADHVFLMTPRIDGSLKPDRPRPKAHRSLAFWKWQAEHLRMASTPPASPTG